MLSTLLDLVANPIVRDAERTTHHECRDCGTTVAGDAVHCPACGSREIANVDLA